MTLAQERKTTVKKLEEASRAARREIDSTPILVIVLHKLDEILNIVNTNKVKPEEISRLIDIVEEQEENLEDDTPESERESSAA